jgi:hypothetical protein
LAVRGVALAPGDVVVRDALLHNEHSLGLIRQVHCRFLTVRVVVLTQGIL